MNGQGKKLNRFCLTGFLLAVLAPFVCSFCFVITYYPLWYRLGIRMKGGIVLPLIFCTLAIALVMAALGFALSIKGVRSCRRRGERGTGLGVVGIVFAGMFLATVSTVLLSVLITPRESPPTSTTPAVNTLIKLLALTVRSI